MKKNNHAADASILDHSRHKHLAQHQQTIATMPRRLSATAIAAIAKTGNLSPANAQQLAELFASEDSFFWIDRNLAINATPTTIKILCVEVAQ